MPTDDALFGDETTQPDVAQHQPLTGGIAEWQIEQLRSALNAHGLQSMSQRQRAVQELAGRPVSTLRDLTSSEARALLEQLAARSSPATRGPSTSSWDDRAEDTWIDRL